MFLAVSSNHCSWNDWFSIKMFHNFLFIVRTGLKSAGLKCGVRKTTSENFWRPWDEAYLPGREVNHDHEGGSSRARLLHCTKEWLTPAISPNVGNSTSSFLLVGICVRANPCNVRLDRPKGSWPNLSSATLISTSESHGRWHHPLNEDQLCSSATLCLGAKSSEIWPPAIETVFLWFLSCLAFS
jgi:hypothetical protein